MSHRSALLLVPLLSVAWLAPAAANSVRVNANWDDLQAMLSSNDYRTRVKIRLKSSKQTSGTLTGSTRTGLQLARKGRQVTLPRDEIHAVRLVPRRAARNRGRTLALLAGAPAGFLSGFGALYVCCRGVYHDSGDMAFHEYAAFFGTAAAVTYQLYRLGSKSDRGSVLIVLTESANGSPSTSTKEKIP